MLASLLVHTTRSSQKLQPWKNTYLQTPSERQPSTDEIKRTLRSAVQAFSRVFMIIDAIDERRTSNSCRQAFLQHIFDLRAQCGINVFSTSGYTQDVTDRFKTQEAEIVEIRARDDDLKMFLRDQIAPFHRKLLKENSGLIEAKIIEVVDGMFPFIRLLFQSIEHKTSPQQLKAALEDLSGEKEVYLTAYKSIMDRIQAQHLESSRLSYHVLEWVVCAQRPLAILELQHALVIISKISARPEVDHDLAIF
ncbi:hypothetical protein TWF788_010379 [Orbilia oligospora]|uniref:Nephrocystin 3-like N-terminal domain-containing protein n=1 Tax=Orbilia oligospora TaxID=2813651 RepID=A0A7C8KE12_ORBOL|nr:hypothetical protein TWF788_010379 [Orbilia oligospora]KAF3197751.1 hypothetical protein TWF679_002801 [Orbilia oligospora]